MLDHMVANAFLPFLDTAALMLSKWPACWKLLVAV